LLPEIPGLSVARWSRYKSKVVIAWVSDVIIPDSCFDSTLGRFRLSSMVRSSIGTKKDGDFRVNLNFKKLSHGASEIIKDIDTLNRIHRQQAAALGREAEGRAVIYTESRIVVGKSKSFGHNQPQSQLGKMPAMSSLADGYVVIVVILSLQERLGRDC
jgi:hypothetical protein